MIKSLLPPKKAFLYSLTGGQKPFLLQCGQRKTWWSPTWEANAAESHSGWKCLPQFWHTKVFSERRFPAARQTASAINNTETMVAPSSHGEIWRVSPNQFTLQAVRVGIRSPMQNVKINFFIAVPFLGTWNNTKQKFLWFKILWKGSSGLCRYCLFS